MCNDIRNTICVEAYAGRDWELAHLKIESNILAQTHIGKEIQQHCCHCRCNINQNTVAPPRVMTAIINKPIRCGKQMEWQ